MGPTAVALTIRGPWVLGAIVNQQWSYAGWGDNDVSAMLIQSFINLRRWRRLGTYLKHAVITADWEATSGNSVDRAPWAAGWASCSGWASCPSTRSYRSTPTWRNPISGPDWQLHFQIQFLLPGFK